jgi:hypothetical protein
MQLCDVVAIVESSNNPHCMRFEPALYASPPEWIVNQLPAIKRAHPWASDDTVKLVATSSFGYYQILGANIWSLGYTSDFMTYLNDDIDQRTVFTKFIVAHGFSAADDCTQWSIQKFQEFAAFYNGPSGITMYSAAMIQAVKNG